MIAARGGAGCHWRCRFPAMTTGRTWRGVGCEGQNGAKKNSLGGCFCAEFSEAVRLTAHEGGLTRELIATSGFVLNVQTAVFDHILYHTLEHRTFNLMQHPM